MFIMNDVIVVGGGHAGIEAALACARLGKSTLLITLSLDMIGSMPCNPSIGGPAKGVVVREIDALGGQMGITADKTALQFKMLNTNKGPGVQCLRVQSDKDAYSQMMLDVLSKQKKLTLIEGLVSELLVENNRVIGVICDGQSIYAQAVILTTGTYLNSKVMVSDVVVDSGPDGQPTTSLLTDSIHQQGITTFRLKTGTPPRVLTNTIDFAQTEIQPGSEDFLSFSFLTKKILPFEQQLPCYLTYTNELTHQIIRDNLHLSSMYAGVVKGVGPRYCPSIEDKIVRFSDKPRHQIFLEPETSDFKTTYVQGFSTSLPYEVQDQILHSLAGLQNATIAKYAYAIEYDAINPLQLKASLELRGVEHLYAAGQINGTSGYEEAAGQGLMAGINAVLKLDNKAPFILGRDEAYIGVMIDDLITKGTLEPYRLLTSRAEYRLLLRHDNADIRLSAKGHQIGLVDKQRYQVYQEKITAIAKATIDLSNIKVKDYPIISEYCQQFKWEKPLGDINILELLKRPLVSAVAIKELLGLSYSDEVIQQLDIQIKYQGYIVKAKKDAEKIKQLEQLQIPNEFDYQKVAHLSLEARSKLIAIRPFNLGQASRISGVSPADIATLLLYL